MPRAMNHHQEGQGEAWAEPSGGPRCVHPERSHIRAVWLQCLRLIFNLCWTLLRIMAIVGSSCGAFSQVVALIIRNLQANLVYLALPLSRVCWAPIRQCTRLLELLAINETSCRCQATNHPTCRWIIATQRKPWCGGGTTFIDKDFVGISQKWGYCIDWWSYPPIYCYP